MAQQEHRSFRRRIAILTVMVALASVALLIVHPFSYGPQPGDLAVTFVGLTNNPVGQFSPFRLEVPQGTTGKCALFMVKSVRSYGFIDFKAVAVDVLKEGAWLPVQPAEPWRGVEGSVWSPQYGCLYAVAWPPEIKNADVWRLRVTVSREPPRFVQKIRDMLRNQISIPNYGTHTVESSPAQDEPDKTNERSSSSIESN